MKLIDLTGETFTRLTVITRVESSGNKVRWLCRCECGKQTVVIGGNLRRGTSTSCGCLMRELAAERSWRHGQKRTPTYIVWCGLRGRCLNPANTSYGRYGGRGITVCDRWTDFKNFLADMGERPSDPPDWSGRVAYWSLDRIDNDKGYGPGNCRWASPRQQANNRRHPQLDAIATAGGQ